MSLSKVIPQPRMLLKKSKGRVSFKQLKSFTNTDGMGDFNEQVDMVNSDMQFIDLEPMPISYLPYKEFTILSDNNKLERIFCIFRFPDKMEGILSKAVAKTSQFHFLTPKTFIRNKVLTMFVNLDSRGSTSEPSFINNSKELNFMEVQQLSSQA